MNFLVYIIKTLFSIFYWLLIIRALITWLKPNIHDPNWRKLLKLLYDLTEPILGPIRKILPSNSWGIDFSPLIALLALSILRSFIIRLLYYLAMDIGI